MKPEENNTYIIPPNYVDTGTVFGGTIKLRNAAEAVALSLLIGIPVFQLPFKLTTKIIICCLTVLPAALLAVIGINGDSLTGFLFSFILYLKKRRIVGGEEAVSQTTTKEASAGAKAQKVSSPSKKHRREARVKPKKGDFPEEFGQLKERKASSKKATGSQPKKNGKRLSQKIFCRSFRNADRFGKVAAQSGRFLPSHPGDQKWHHLYKRPPLCQNC